MRRDSGGRGYQLVAPLAQCVVVVEFLQCQQQRQRQQQQRQ